jgi:hypothetical protein
MDKFLGLGLKNLIGVFLFIVLMILLTKVVFTKYQVKGVTEAVQAL